MNSLNSLNSLKKGEVVPLLKFVENPGIPLLNFEGGPGVPLLNFRGVPSLGVLVPLLHHARILHHARVQPKVIKFRLFMLTDYQSFIPNIKIIHNNL